MTLAKVITDLENLFTALNNHYFNNQLEEPVITVSPDNTKGAYGWCTSYKAWKNGETEHYEINICSEYLDRGTEAVAETMLHEMVHLKNLMDGIKDTSNNGFYHNTKYRKTAEQYGLTVEKDPKYGWCKTSMTEETKQFIESLELDEITVVRKKMMKPVRASKSNSIRYICPGCGAIVRATKPVMIGCMDCNLMMVES